MYRNFKLPKTAEVDKFIPKNKFYEKASLNSKTQSDFTDKIQKITWKHKLAETTIHIDKTDKINEIQIFEIELKTKCFPENVLKAIDKAIPYPILYILTYKKAFAYAIFGIEANTSNRCYKSEWNEVIIFDFSGLNLEIVYQKLVKCFITPSSNDMGFKDLIELDYEINTTLTRIERLTKKMKLEKQFNKKIEINRQIKIEKDSLNKMRDE